MQSSSTFPQPVCTPRGSGAPPDPPGICTATASLWRRQAVLTPAKVYESEVADQLLSGDESTVYADRAYESKERRNRLSEQGIKDRIMHRSHKHQPELPYWQQRRNELIEPIRRAAEKVFGTWKRSYGYRRVRYRGLERNTVQMSFKAMAYNLRRADRLTVPCA